MKKILRCFIENAELATPSNRTVSPIYELSDEGTTFAKQNNRMSLKGDDKNLVWAFHVSPGEELTREDATFIVSVTESLNMYLKSVTVEKKPAIISGFTKFFNNSNTKPISDFYYNNLVSVKSVNYPDFFSFENADISVSVWLSDETFKLTYPLYDIDVTPPFDNFDKIVRNPVEMVKALNSFDVVVFNQNLNITNEGFPPTYTEFLNVPYRPSKKADEINCYFGFNIYGAQGNYDYLLREHLYDYLKGLGLDDAFIEEHFPSLFKVNEFFIIPTWDQYAIPFGVGQGSINSQFTKTYTEPFTMDKFVPAYENSAGFIKNNTNNVPFNYNNIVARVLNGKYSTEEYKDFTVMYKDLLTVSSTNPDFSRMSERTQKFVILMEYLLESADAKNTTELFNKVSLANKNLGNAKKDRINVTQRAGATYITTRRDNVRYYVMPRHDYDRIKGAL